MSLISGKLAFVLINSTDFSFDEYTMNIDGELPDMSHFGAGGGVYLVDGVTINDVELSGPYDIGNMPLTRGAEYDVSLGLAVGIMLEATCRVAKISVSNKYKDGPRVKVSLKASDGVNFTASIS